MSLYSSYMSTSREQAEVVGQYQKQLERMHREQQAEMQGQSQRHWRQQVRQEDHQEWIRQQLAENVEQSRYYEQRRLAYQRPRDEDSEERYLRHLQETELGRRLQTAQSDGEVRALVEYYERYIKAKEPKKPDPVQVTQEKLKGLNIADESL